MCVDTWLGAVLKVSYAESPLDVGLRHLALSLWRQEEGLARSNRGGWHSRYLDVENATIAALGQRVQKATPRFLQRNWTNWTGTIHLAAVWANVHRLGEYNVEHQHAEVGAEGDHVPLLSGVYYPGPRSLSRLCFPDCDPSVEPEPGTLVLFLATLPHSVRAADLGAHELRERQEPRVSWAFNLVVRRADAEGFTPLHHAAETGHVAMVGSLLEGRASPWMKTAHGSLPIHLAASAGRVSVVEKLLSLDPSLAQGSAGSALLHTAAANGQTALLRQLISLRASLQADGDGTALHRAVQNGHTAAARLLLQVDPTQIHSADAAGHLPAHEAARGGLEVLEYLLQARMSPNVKDAEQRSLLYWAVHGGHTRTVDLLLQARAEVEIPSSNDQGSARGEAMANYLAAALIGSGSRPQLAVDELSPMHIVAAAGHVQMATWLESKLIPKQNNMPSRLPPLHLAAGDGHVEMVRWLLPRAEKSARGGITSLHMAALGGHVQVIELLLEMQSDVSAAAVDGSQPLHVAAASGHKEIARTLLLARADADAKTRKKHSPLDRAQEASGNMNQLNQVISG
ncbi:unnamed protein product [Effrenium voratum]|nr:unnamed protein product [Effrenium voratum]CAJ1452870.1 unnamed protein product [Effrenium voratum]